ncbi:mitogen-activated protein kinase kinase kinase 1-like isoform X2 [Clytia hemisphaerica]|uniref:Uncharacterized protein n=1 Tax=Clytia hemisphaerica TaxID=252671 RepID=A0A7M5VB11_9CNID
MMSCKSSSASPTVEKGGGRRRSPSPRVVHKRAQSPIIDPQLEADMNRVKKQVPKVQKARLYLLQQPGPNSFLIGGDSPDHKYKVIVGPQTCTCGKDPFCIHILFVMLRVFKVKETDPLLWNRELKNFEVESLFRKYHKRLALLTKQKVRPSTLAVKDKTSTSISPLPDPLHAAGHTTHGHHTVKEEEEVCPICLSDLVEGESMTLCKEGCQNRLHHHCMAVWAEECRRRKEALNCPLCRTIWQSRRSSSPFKMTRSGTPTEQVDIQQDDHGLPRGEVVPEQYQEMTQSWVQVFGNDPVACLFSKDWKHRECGLRFISRKAVKVLSEKRTTVSYRETKWELLSVCTAVLAYIVSDPVYNVYVAALRAFRAIVTNVRYQTQEELNTLHLTIKPVIEKILIKCSDSNRRVTILSMKILMEFVSGETASIQNPSNSTINNTQQHMDLIASCLNQEEDQTQWQWWLGRLSFVRRLFDEHHSQLLLASENRINMASSLPVSPNSDVDLREFLNSLAENVHSDTKFTSKTCERILLLARFSARALSCPHQKVHRHALFLMIKCIAISSQDSVLYPSIKQIVYGLTSNHQSTLHRHLSNESQREQADILNILGEHGEERNEQNATSVVEEEEQHSSEEVSLQHQTPTSARLQDVSTSPIASPSTPEVHPPHLSPPTSSYDPHLKCVRAVEDEEAAAIAIALDRSQRRPENVIPEQLIPTDDLTIVHIQPDGDKKSKDGEVCKPRNVYLEEIHWKKGGLVGTGAFSSCYEAMDFKSGRIMAVKQISFVRNTEEEQEKVHQIVLEEIALLHRIKHPNIVSCLGATQHEAHYNLFMELMPGGSISSLLGKFGAFRESVTKSYTQQILQAVTYLHQHHTLHRDLKGANLLVDSTGQIVKLSDFGTAARLMAHGTGTKEFCGQLLGTIPFMSPEVLRGEHYGRKCDVWSIGCCIIEMASGYPPWGSQHVDNHLALMFKIASSTTGPHIPSSLGPGMRDLTLRCLELKEANRPSSAELLQHAVFRT